MVLMTQGNKMNPTWPRLLCAGALALTSLLAHAQYSWLDDKGSRVFSDRPPPPGTPPGRILKTPRGLEPRVATPEPAAGAAADKAKEPAVVDKELEFRKRAAQREAEETKAAQEASNKAARNENCNDARDNERALSSGIRISRVNDKGEKEFLSDEERARRMERTRKILKSCS
jgi:hypothetical protein